MQKMLKIAVIENFIKDTWQNLRVADDSISQVLIGVLYDNEL